MTPAMMRLLIVDQLLLFREGLSLLVEQEPDWCVVGEAGTVQEALRLTDKLQPNLILTELALPDGTALDIARQLLPGSPTVKLVILTSEEDDAYLFQAIRLGVKGYLPKNLSGRELLKHLKTVTGGERVLTPSMVERVMDEFARQSDCGNRANQVDGPMKFAFEHPGEEMLSRRERDVLSELRRGASNKEIAKELIISENTVKHHVSQILFKLNCQTRRDLAMHLAVN